MDCSEVVATLPADSAGLYQNEAISVCEQCDQECLGGCAGGTVHHTHTHSHTLYVARIFKIWEERSLLLESCGYCACSNLLQKKRS